MPIGGAGGEKHAPGGRFEHWSGPPLLDELEMPLLDELEIPLLEELEMPLLEELEMPLLEELEIPLLEEEVPPLLPPDPLPVPPSVTWMTVPPQPDRTADACRTTGAARSERTARRPLTMSA